MRYRNYTNSNFQERVEKTYQNMLTNQTEDFVQNMKEKYKTYPNINTNIWNTINYLENIKDESDPDSDLPQIVHAYQTAISLETKNIEKFPIKNLFTKKEWELLDSGKKQNTFSNRSNIFSKISFILCVA